MLKVNRADCLSQFFTPGRLVENEGLIMVGGAPRQLGEYVKEQEMLWRKVVHEAGIKIE